MSGAATDVTGFGLLGHAYKMARASGVSMIIDAAAVPYLDGARRSLADGYVSGGTRRNLDWVRPHLDAGGAGEDELLLLADAQTSGGLLVVGEIPGSSGDRRGRPGRRADAGGPMIRNVVVGRLPEDADEQARAQLDRGLAGIAALRLPGLIETRVGRDLGLRAGGWSFAITNDWTDADAYRSYDVDSEHNVYRAMVAAVCTELARVQFEI